MKHLSCSPRDSWCSQNLFSIPGGNQTVRGSLKIAVQGLCTRLREGEVKRERSAASQGAAPSPATALSCAQGETFPSS